MILRTSAVVPGRPKAAAQTYEKREPAARWRIAKHVINGAARCAGVRSRNEEDEVGGESEPGTKCFRVPVEGLDFLRQPEVEVHGIELGTKPLCERLAPHKPLGS